ncbi:stromal cell-derived factor 2 [Bicyclus anynana]|uniref:Stromal cell-derived factor 2 n=1 Tax=Bicyclus anynana TaxID=110368 RepID=A0A6J1NWY7_BICAN|nr:stromal cell-derived factor 2 [Bicyclus anynana]
MIFGKIFINNFHFIKLLSIVSLWAVQVAEGSRAEYVTCGSILKLLNTDLKLRLHSHDVKYGSGSGQQSVTAVDVTDDNNSHWLVRAAKDETCKRGAPIKCNSNIRLQHVSTKKNLHSHYFSSPLSGNQEVSCYGDENGEGDSGDNWTVVCNNDFWRRDTPVKLRHVDTAAYLAGSGRTFGRPISGQGEIVGVSSQYGAYTDWQSQEGLFVHPSDLLPHQQAQIIHTEL